MLTFVQLFIIVGAREPRPLANAGWNTQTIRIELIVGRDSYLDKILMYDQRVGNPNSDEEFGVCARP